MKELSEFIYGATGVNPEMQIKILSTIVVSVGLFLVRNFVIKIIYKKAESSRTRYLWRKTMSYITITLLIIIVSKIWYEGFARIGTFLGLLSAGIAIALKDLLANIAAWFFILIRRPFTLGDRIEVDGEAGDVIDIRAFQFTLMEIRNWVEADQSTGRIIHIPNGKIFTKSLANFTKGFQYIWNETPVTVTFESNWKKAKQLLTYIANKHTKHLRENAEENIIEASHKFMINYKVLTPTVYTKVVDIGICLTIRYLCEPRKRRNSEQIIWEEVLAKFAECPDIKFAYPTQRININEQ